MRREFITIGEYYTDLLGWFAGRDDSPEDVIAALKDEETHDHVSSEDREYLLDVVSSCLSFASRILIADHGFYAFECINEYECFIKDSLEEDE